MTEYFQCNLKPVAMRGVKSFAMLLCASSKEGKEEGGVEFVLPPEGSQAGERVYFEGEKYQGMRLFHEAMYEGMYV